MRRAFGGIGAALLGCALAQGCGSSGSPEAMGQFGGDYVAAVCQRILACCSGAEIAAVDPTIVDQASCETALAPSSGSLLVTGAAAVDAGVAVYHGDAARACLTALAALPCGMWSGPLALPRVPQCDGIFVGTLPAGSTCGTSVECASNYCTNNNTGGDSCAAPVTGGQSCEFAPCTSGLSCVSPPGGNGLRTCGEPSPAGSPCFYNQDCTSGFCTLDATTGQSTCSPATSCPGP